MISYDKKGEDVYYKTNNKEKRCKKLVYTKFGCFSFNVQNQISSVCSPGPSKPFLLYVLSFFLKLGFICFIKNFPSPDKYVRYKFFVKKSLAD